MVFSLWTLNLSLHGKHEPIALFFSSFFLLASKLENPLKHFHMRWTLEKPERKHWQLVLSLLWFMRPYYTPFF